MFYVFQKLKAAKFLNSHLLSFYHSNSVQIYINEFFKNKLLTLINKPTRVASKSISVIDHINTNFLLNLVLRQTYLITLLFL